MKTNNNFNLLIVDDEEINTELASLYLQEEGYKIFTALNAQDALKIISRKQISLILLDINMPHIDGFKLCAMLKEEQKTQDIPVVFLTAQNDIDFITKAFEIGGADYITKPFNPLELKARVKVQLQNIAYLEEIKEKQSKLAQLSITDPLSKLYNGLYFDAHIKTLQSKEEAFWIFYIKIDNFEKINKLYGFHNTNKLVRIFSKLLTKTLFKNAIVSRLFSAHFAVITKAYSKEDMQKLYKLLQDTIKKDPTLKGSIEFSAILIYVPEKIPPSLPLIYKKIQTSLTLLENSNNKMMFV
jgi:diguanylate cyclase (GGDEF)-like protein